MWKNVFGQVFYTEGVFVGYYIQYTAFHISHIYPFSLLLDINYNFSLTAMPYRLSCELPPSGEGGTAVPPPSESSLMMYFDGTELAAIALMYAPVT